MRQNKAGSRKKRLLNKMHVTAAKIFFWFMSWFYLSSRSVGIYKLYILHEFKLIKSVPGYFFDRISSNILVIPLILFVLGPESYFSNRKKAKRNQGKENVFQIYTLI